MSEPTFTGRATTGTWVYSAKPDTNYYTAAKSSFRVQSGAREAFFHTPLPPGLRGRHVASAYIEITPYFTADSRTYTVQRNAALPARYYSRTTWRNRPGVLAGSTAASHTGAGAPQTRRINVTAEVQAIADGGAYHGWRLTSSVAGNQGIHGFRSKYPPRLVVELVPLTPPTPELSPNGVTALAAPTFTWAKPNGLAGVQLQVAATDDETFTAPLWDSGDVSTTVAQLDTAAAGWAGQADGGSVLVRARLRTSGWGAWSDPVTVTRQSYGALVIDTTGDAGDPTPTVEWTYTPGLGGDATRWQVLTYLNNKLVDNSGIRPGTDDDAYSPAKGATKNGDVLRQVVRVWDDADRDLSPGDPGYAQAEVTRTFLTSAIAGPSALTATQVGDAPWVDLAWTGTADEWLIYRDGVLLDRVEGDVLTWRDYTAPPNTPVTYQVFPFLEGFTGSTSPTISVQTEVTGVWLVDTVTELWFSCGGTALEDPHGESTTIYEPPGGSRVVKRTFALRGRRGNASGAIEDAGGRTAAEQLADLKTIKGDVDTESLRLIYGDCNYPAVVWDLDWGLDKQLFTTDQQIHAASFSFAQAGELDFDQVEL